MAYILDTDKSDLGHYTIPISSAPIVTTFADSNVRQTLSINNGATLYSLPAVRSLVANYAITDLTANGMATWAPASGGGGSNYNFTALTDASASYTIIESDDVIDVISDTYQAIYLPLISGLNAGHAYTINRSSNNNALKIMAQTGQFIDDETEYRFWRKYTRISVVSNGVDKWYIV